MAVAIPRGSIYTTIRELGPQIPPIQGIMVGPNSLMVVYVDPLGLFSGNVPCLFLEKELGVQVATNLVILRIRDVCDRCCSMFVGRILQFFKIGVPKHRPQYILILIMGTPKKDTRNHGKPPRWLMLSASGVLVLDYGDLDNCLGMFAACSNFFRPRTPPFVSCLQSLKGSRTQIIGV